MLARAEFRSPLPSQRRTCPGHAHASIARGRDFFAPDRSSAMTLHNAQTDTRADKFDAAQPDTRLTKEAAIAHSGFIPRVMALWDEGLDTSEIARRLSEHEYVVASCVRIGRERRRIAAARISAGE
jgi:hypothetical protein